MVLQKILDKLGISREKVEAEEAPDFVEVNPLAEEGRINVRVDSLKGFNDVERVQQMVREGNVVFLKIKELWSRDKNELKRSVERLKKTVSASNGDIVAVSDDFLVVTPSFARIYRGKVA